MKKVNYTEALKKQLELVRSFSQELAKEAPNKSVEQFLAEIEFVKNLVEETKQFID